MNIFHILSALGGAAIGSFFTHVFHLRQNELKIKGKNVVPTSTLSEINAAGAIAADAATAAAQKQIDGASGK